MPWRGRGGFGGGFRGGPRFGGGGGYGGGGGSLKGKQPGGALRPVNWERVNLKPFEKNFYNATSASRNADPREVERFRLVNLNIFYIYDDNDLPN